MSKVDEWKASIQVYSKPSIILLTETWLHDQIPDSLILLQGYTLHHDIIGREGGDVWVFILNTISGHPVRSAVSQVSGTSHPIESLWIELSVNGRQLLISCMYRPKASTTVEDNRVLIAVLKRACNTKTPTYIFGDFNYTEIDWPTLSVHNTTTRIYVVTNS